MQPPPFSLMNREERHLCAILYHLLMDADNLSAFQSLLGLPASDDVHVFVEAAFVRDYFNWWRQEYRRKGKATGQMAKASKDFDGFCQNAFTIDSRQASGFRASDDRFLSLWLLHHAPRGVFADPYCAFLPSLAQMRLDLLLIRHDAFVIIETKLHSELDAEQVYLQQVLGAILNRLPGYEQHKFYHFVVSSNTSHPRLGAALRRHEAPVGEPQVLSWRHVLGSLPRICPREREEIDDMLRRYA
jgi:hypothetical protein